jgi:hypothetical protein
MRQKRKTVQRSKTQGYPLLEHINPHHPLVVLAAMIDWSAIERVASEPVLPRPGRPPIRPRLIAGLLYLQHAFDLSDEEVVAMWVENPYWQVFTGETRGGPENSDSRISGRFASQSRPEGRIQGQKHDQENKTEPLRKFQGESGLSGVTRG